MNEDFLINAIFGSRYKLKSGVEFHTTPPRIPSDRTLSHWSNWKLTRQI